MALKKRSLLSPKIRAQLEEAMLEALQRHIHGKSKPRAGHAAARKKKAGKKKVSRAARKPVRKAKARRRSRR
jgi:hypothetical protein